MEDGICNLSHRCRHRNECECRMVFPSLEVASPITAHSLDLATKTTDEIILFRLWFCGFVVLCLTIKLFDCCNVASVCCANKHKHLHAKRLSYLLCAVWRKKREKSSSHKIAHKPLAAETFRRKKNVPLKHFKLDCYLFNQRTRNEHRPQAKEMPQLCAHPNVSSNDENDLRNPPEYPFI